MKKLLTLIIFGISPFLVFCQVPQAFNYQAVVRDTAGNIQYNTTADFKIEILQNGNSIYSENHLGKETGKTGVVNFKIGMGSEKVGDFSTIDWSAGQYQIEVNLNDGDLIGKTDIVAVPFALYAERSGGSTDWFLKGDSILYNSNKWIGLGTDVPQQPLHVNGAGRFKSLQLWTENTEEWPRLRYKTTTGKDMYWEMPPGGDFYLFDPESQKYRLFFDKEEGFTGIWTTTPQQPLHVNGGGRFKKLQLWTEGTGEWPSLRIKTTSGKEMYWEMPESGDLYLYDPHRQQYRIYYAINGNTGIGTNQPDASLHVNGRTKTKVLEITGGSDLAEPFEITKDGKLPTGSVVVIDDQNPGKLVLAYKAYDKKVAGVVSGAGGVNPGITLHQDGVMEGNQLVALAGRAYVKACTVNGVIQPGDLLTSSSIPGYAMKATNKRKRQGAVIGKAMSGLDEGEGLVLVLIQPQ